MIFILPVLAFSGVSVFLCSMYFTSNFVIDMLLPFGLGLLVGAGAFFGLRWIMGLYEVKDSDGFDKFVAILCWIILVIFSPCYVIGIILWAIGKFVFKIEDGDGRGIFYILSFVAFIWQIVCVVAIIFGGFESFLYTFLFNGGIILLVLMWALGYYIFYRFSEIEYKKKIDYVTLFINTPTLIIAFIITTFTGALLEWIKNDNVSTNRSNSNSNDEKIRIINLGGYERKLKLHEKMGIYRSNAWWDIYIDQFGDRWCSCDKGKTFIAKDEIPIK